MSSHTTVKAANWRFVELGRVVLINNKELATVVEIIDQKRVCI
jgi:large subunit ribosomal protein L14e